jgi:hypothetical protein
MEESADSAVWPRFNGGLFCVLSQFSMRDGPILRPYVACSPDDMAKSRDLRVRGFQFTVDIVRLCREHVASDPIIKAVWLHVLAAAYPPVARPSHHTCRSRQNWSR